MRRTKPYLLCLLWLTAACARNASNKLSPPSGAERADSAVAAIDDAGATPSEQSRDGASIPADTNRTSDAGIDSDSGRDQAFQPGTDANGDRRADRGGASAELADRPGPDAATDLTPNGSPALTLYPANTSVAFGARQKLSATVTGTTDTRVGWAMQESSDCGTVDDNGLYSAPVASTTSATKTCHVVATLLADTRVGATALIGLVAPGNPGQACAAEALRTIGQIHYVCDCQSGADPKCVAGSDSNNGTSPSTPLQSLGKASSAFGSLKAGDTIAFCRGGRWNVKSGNGWVNGNCQKANTCDIRDYAPPWGDGSQASPSIWLDGGAGNSTLMAFQHPAQHVEGYRVLNLDLHGTGTDNGIFFYNETTDVDLCNLTMDGFATSVQMGGGDSPTLGLQSNIVLRGSRITNNTNIAYIAACDYCSVEDNYFDNDGARSATTHTIYFASQAYNVGGTTVVHTAQGMRLSRNEIHYSTQQCLGAPVVAHGRHQDLIIENNIIDAADAVDACWGPGVGCGGYAYGCWFRNTMIRGNTFRNLGNVGSDNSACTDCTIENNLFILNRGGTGVSIGGTAPRPAGDATYTEWDGSPDDPTNNVTIRNNTFYLQDASTAASAIEIYSGTGHVIENNAIAFVGGKSTSDACYRLPGNPTTALASADHNVCNLAANVAWTSFPPKYGTSLTDWQAQGFEKHSQQTDPMFSAPPTSFVPAVGSPLVNACDASDSPSDDLTRKPRDSQPDIGAYEL